MFILKKCTLKNSYNQLLLAIPLVFSLMILYNKNLPATNLDNTFTDCQNCPEMIKIPAGEFMMGSDTSEIVLGKTRTEGPKHIRKIKTSFAVGINEVTNKEFETFIQETNYRPSQSCTKWRGKVIQFNGNWLNPDYGRPPAENEPVVCVSWYDAKAYTLWLSGKTGQVYRLLSEAEWEYIAKNKGDESWSWGEKETDACKYSNIFDLDGIKSDYAKEFATWKPTNCADGYQRVAPVRSFPPNNYGVYDITGNVWEWAEDCSEINYKTVELDEKPNQVEGHCKRRSVKGGSWLSKISRHRPSFRGRDPENLSSHIFGFRVAKDL